MLIPFFNSQLQGWYKIYQSLVRNDPMGMSRDAARKLLVTKGVKMAAASIDAVQHADGRQRGLSESQQTGSRQ